MRVTPEIHLSVEQKRQLKELISKGVSPARVQTRARVLLMGADRSRSSSSGEHRKTNSNQAIAEALSISARTVSRIRQRFVSGGMEAALYDQSRTGRPVEVDGEAEAHLLALAASDPPEGRDHWTLQLLADRMVELGYVAHISDTWVHARLKKANFILGPSRAGASRE